MVFSLFTRMNAKNTLGNQFLQNSMFSSSSIALFYLNMCTSNTVVHLITTIDICYLKISSAVNDKYLNLENFSSFPFSFYTISLFVSEIFQFQVNVTIQCRVSFKLNTMILFGFLSRSFQRNQFSQSMGNRIVL